MKIAVATCVYEAARPWLGDWIDGVIAAKSQFAGEVRLIIVNDGLRDADHTLSALQFAAETKIIPTAAATIPLVRRDMCKVAASEDVNAVIFLDCDDVILPDAIKLHVDALSKADISYGNLKVLVAEHDVDTEELFFSPECIPRSVSFGGLDRGNVIGFGNSAVRKDVLANGLHGFHKDVELADWFFYRRLVQCGYVARQTAGPVARYRLLDTGLASKRPRHCDETFQRHINLLRVFLEHQPDHYRFSSVIEFLAGVQSDPGIERRLGSMSDKRGPWFSYLFELCGYMAAIKPQSSKQTD